MCESTPALAATAALAAAPALPSVCSGLRDGAFNTLLDKTLRHVTRNATLLSNDTIATTLPSNDITRYLFQIVP
uniref:Secreted protein n=1 Tax=Steinernema glaseri TaxID=37863 RepID=A0A1I7ZLG2_9BILA